MSFIVKYFYFTINFNYIKYKLLIISYTGDILIRHGNF